MKWILCTLFLIFAGYFFLSGEKESLPDLEISESQVNKKHQSASTREPARVEHIEVRNGSEDDPQKTYPDFVPSEGENHFKSLMDTDEDEAMVYLRRVLLRSQIPVEDKIEFFHAALTYLPKEEVTTICRLILNGKTEPELYLEAMKVQLKEIDPNQREQFLRQRYQQTYDKKTKRLIQKIGKALYYDL